MDSFEFNKIAGAILATALVVFGLKEMAGIIYHAEAPEKPGMMIEVATAATDATAGETEEEADEPVTTLLASADLDAGLKQMSKCKSCHTWDNGGKSKVGPNLWDIVGRNLGAVEGFKYSSGMAKKSSETWSYESLDAFLKKPKDFIPKTAMKFAGFKDAKRRADVIGYLRSLSDDPKPLPAE